MAAYHRKARCTAIHFFGLFDQREAFDDFLAELGLALQIEHQRQLAPLFDPLLPLQFAVAVANPLVEHFAQLRIAFENEMDRTLRNHQQPRIGRRDHRRHLLLAHQARFLAEYLAFAERGKRVVVPFLVPHDTHCALSHHVQAPVLASVLLEDFLARGHPFHANTAHILLEFRLVQLAAQIE